MGRVVLCPLPERGHVNATFALAKGLHARGHDVRYLTGPAVAEHVRAQGFAFVPMFGELFPASVERAHTWSRVGMRALYTRADAYVAATGLAAELSLAAPDLVLVDSYWCSVALAAFRRGLRVVMITPTFAWARDPRVPPRSTFRVPRGAVSKLGIRASWLPRDAGAAVLRRLGLGDRERLRRLASSFGYPAAQFDGGSLFAGPPRLTRFPELLLYPRALDLPRSLPANVVHAGASVDLERIDRDAGPSDEDRTGDLVFCSLGTQTEASAGVPSILRSVLAALGSLRSVRGVVATGDRISKDALGPVPPNVSVVRWVPQLDVLRRSSVFITHGGLNGVKESVLLGVPMIVVPWARPATAIRVAYHGLGMAIARRQAKPRRLRDAIERILSEPAWARRVRAMRDVILEDEKAENGFALVERELAAAS